MNTINTLLSEEIQDEIETLKEMQEGTDEYKATVDGIVKLTDRLIDLQKIDNETEDKEKNREAEEAKNYFEQDLKRKQFEEEKAKNEFERNLKTQQIEADQKDRVIRYCIDVASIVLPICLTIWGTKKSFEFEKEGTITTIMGRGFINRLFHKK